MFSGTLCYDNVNDYDFLKLWNVFPLEMNWVTKKLNHFRKIKWKF
jgi:hypothetical protein